MWYVLREIYGDGSEWLALANTFAFYLFAPLVLLGLLILAARQYPLLPALGAPLALVILLFGAQCLPPTVRADPTQPTLRVMTFNVNGNREPHELATEQIVAYAPDLVLIQELSPRHAADLNTRFSTHFPYQQLEPIPGRRGIGILSRYPLQARGWLKFGKDPQAAQRAQIEWQGHSLQIINVHLASTMPGENVAASFREREMQVQELLALVAQEKKPTLIGGDFNLTDTSHAYSMLARELSDAHRAAGWGLGFTFPSSPELVRSFIAAPFAKLLQTRENNVESALASVPLPPTPLLRIDYIFSTNDLRAVNAFTAPWDGQSDHCAVIAMFQLNGR